MGATFYDEDTRDLIAFKDELGRQTDFEYDNLHRMTKMIQPAASPGDVCPTFF